MKRETREAFLAPGLGALLVFFLLSSNCVLFEQHEPFECSLVELRENPSSGYYDAQVSITRIRLENPLKTRFLLVTPTTNHEVAELTFTEEGKDPERLEAGDEFIIPLKKPDWKFFIRDENEIYCVENFWQILPERDRWHPLKSEAAQVAESLQVEFIKGMIKPLIGFLPDEWEKTGETLPSYDDPCGELVFQKIRAEEIKEEVSVFYCPLTEEEKIILDTTPVIEFLKGWSEWTKKSGQPDEVVGHPAISWDMEGIGLYGWSYRYLYIDKELVIEVNIEADPLEWVKTPGEKRMEKKSREVFLRYGYGPVGEPGWQVLIEIRRSGEGALRKRSRTGISIQKKFVLADSELEEIERVLADNHFLELKSRSGVSGGITSFIAARYGEKIHTVEMKNATDPFFQRIEEKIRELVLPRVDER